MRRVLIAGLRSTLQRLVATTLAVVLAVAFIVATLTLSATFTQTTEQTLTADMVNADVRITPTIRGVATSDPSTSKDRLLGLLPTVREVAQVTSADIERVALVDLRAGDERTVAQAHALLEEPVRWQELASGAWPAADGEATLDAPAAKSLGVGIGDTVAVGASDAGVAATEVTIVGITAATAAGVGTGAPTLLMMPAVLDNPGLFAVSTGILVAGDGTAPGALSDLVATALAGSTGIVVQTKDEAVDYQTGQLSGSASVITSILLAFAVIALFVAGMVIANTFQVLVAQRTRELALLRCIGASTGQVRLLILGEAALVGAVASAIGSAVGIAGAGVMADLSRGDGSSLHLGELVIDWRVILLGFVIGVVLTVMSAFSPAQKATRVAPIAAMRAPDAAVRVGRSLLRGILAILLLSAGGWGLLSGATETGLPVAVVSAVVSFLGVLLVSSLVVPWIVRLVGLPFAWLSTPVRLATLNATRNPARTASTAAALLVGVTLVTMMVVGVTSVRASINTKIDEKRPVDMTVQSINPEGLSPELISVIVQHADVVDSTLITSGALRITPSEGEPISLVGRGVAVLESQDIARADVQLPKPGEMLVNIANAAALVTGDTVGVVDAVTAAAAEATAAAQATANEKYAQQQATWNSAVAAGIPVPELPPAPVIEQVAAPTPMQFRVLVSDDAPYGRGTVTDTDLATVLPSHVTSELQLRLADTVSGAEIQLLSTEILSQGDDLRVSGGAAERSYYEQILDVLLLIVLALLAIAVVIAVVGVGNTLSLSVIERRRESGLLRALGLARGQLRRMLATEAALITVVSALIGIGLGIVYAWAGLSAVGLEAEKLPLTVTLPWEQLGMIAGGALLAGLVASVLPATAAARRSPIRGLNGS
ncbi:MAG: hypothetical protein JWQ43_2367 [Glaciihabitans sp.]|nr:hypothetical protein [Glaciihabitans sp.]